MDLDTGGAVAALRWAGDYVGAPVYINGCIGTVIGGGLMGRTGFRDGNRLSVNGY